MTPAQLRNWWNPFELKTIDWHVPRFGNCSISFRYVSHRYVISEASRHVTSRSLLHTTTSQLSSVSQQTSASWVTKWPSMPISFNQTKNFNYIVPKIFRDVHVLAGLDPILARFLEGGWPRRTLSGGPAWTLRYLFEFSGEGVDVFPSTVYFLFVTLGILFHW